MPKSSKAVGVKPSKPGPDFPLTPHNSGRWCKKVKGKIHYFWPVGKPTGMLNRWLDEKDDLLGGRPVRNGAGVTCRELCNAFLESKERLVDSGDITRSHWFDYHRACGRMLDCFGKLTPVGTLSPADFDKLRTAIAKTWGPIALGNEIQRIRSVFKWGIDSELLERAVRFGQNFKKPSKKVRRLARKQAGPKEFSAAELRGLIDKSKSPLKAMVLLGINCGFGQHDLATLPITRLDLHRGWHNYERPKTGTDRRCPLWPETVAALKAALANRPIPTAPEDAELVFITKYGRRWVRLKWTTDTNVRKCAGIDSIGLEFRKLAAELDIKGTGKSFYSLRRTFRTIADEAGDQPATVFIMGHADADDDMSATYRQSIDNTRLRKVTDHVRAWLFPKQRKAK